MSQDTSSDEVTMGGRRGRDILQNCRVEHTHHERTLGQALFLTSARMSVPRERSGLHGIGPAVPSHA
eukprot:scaffold80947_cov36-Phaeocystis_antarctica.AAC.1